MTVYGVDQHDGVVGLWMEFVDGLTLSRVLTTSGVLGPRDAVLIGVDLCGAVAAVHKAGLVHRDIKAQNLIREGGGWLVLMDFGAGELRANPLLTASITGGALFLSPEIFAGSPATIATDIYSIGVLLFHLVTGRYPVEGRTLEQIEAAHARGDRQRLADVRSDLPSSFVPHRRTRAGARSCAAIAKQPRDAAGPGRRAAARTVGRGKRGLGQSGDAHRRDRRPAFCQRRVRARPGVLLGSGLADELSTGLAKVPGLRVASRTSASHVARIENDARSICRALEVDALLEGTVRKAGDQVQDHGAAGERRRRMPPLGRTRPTGR